MTEEIKNCPVCNSKQLEENIECKDHMVSGETFTLTKCIDCNFLFTNPRPQKDNLGVYYKSDQYISHTDKSNNLINSIYRIARKYTLSKKVKLITSFTNNKKILDFGCGTGAFLEACQLKNWEIYGFEPDEQANKLASQNTNIKIAKELNHIKELSDIPIITLWHVLEHIPDLNETIDILKSVLSDDGKIIVAVPNMESYDANHYKQYWAAYDVPRHLYHFSQLTMEKLLAKHGLKINNILPMKLDSFYVSLLSEKYKNGSNNFIKSFINGYKSNIYAKNHNKNYSSLIYIVSK